MYLQVRRKADPAKSLVKDWVKNWRDSPAISREKSYSEISGTSLHDGDMYLTCCETASLFFQQIFK